MSDIEDRLETLGISLPQPPEPVANYVPWIRTGNMVIVSGQLPMAGGELAFKGKLGADIDLPSAQEAAHLCAINLLAQLRAAIRDLDNVSHVLRLGGFVRCADDFEDHPAVINAASDLMVAVFGDAGRHARSAVGVNALPLGAPVEIDGMFEIRQ